MRLSSRCAVVLLSLLSSVGAIGQEGALTLPRDISQLVDRADVIVHGTVMAATVEPHPELKNLTTVLVTLDVGETIKGGQKKTLQFRQYLWDARSAVALAGYRKGDEVLLLLNPVSRYGLTSPVGMEQGRFRISYNSAGQALATNGRNNVGLFQGTATQARRRSLILSARSNATLKAPGTGPVPLADLLEIIRGFSNAKPTN